MDSALLLKQKFDCGEINSYKQASNLLDNSLILKELLNNFDFNILNLLNRLVEISEIPFVHHLEKVKKWRTKLADLSFCNPGFSITGQEDDILSCYNSMIISVLIRLKYEDFSRIEKGIEWILNYQNIERGAANKWTGSRLLKYGGCLKLTPCYIGIIKAMIALTDYKRHSNSINYEIENKLNSGLQYILEHQLYIRQSSESPVTKDITKLTFPFSYKTNIIEILRLLNDNNLSTDKRCNRAKNFLWAKKQKTGYWKANSIYLPKCWIQFDKPGTNGLWLSHEIEKVIN